jgi:chromatin structure-remodeling complex subunit RSC1/2
LKDELQQLQERGFIESADLPELGPLPASSPASIRSKEEEPSSDESDSDLNSDADEDDDDDAGAVDDEEEDEYAEKGVKSDGTAGTGLRPRTRRAATKSGSPTAEDKQDTTAKSSENTPKPETEVAPKKRKRGRPPKIDTPEEARIRSILRAIRKVKDSDGRQLFLEFEKLPDPELYPDYYKEIKRPIALDHITVLLSLLQTNGRKKSSDGTTRGWKSLLLI